MPAVFAVRDGKNIISPIHLNGFVAIKNASTSLFRVNFCTLRMISNLKLFSLSPPRYLPARAMQQAIMHAE